MVPGSEMNGAVDFEAFGKRQTLFVRRMMVPSLLFHGGAILLGSVISPFFPVAVVLPVVSVELTDAPMSSLPAVPPPPPAAPVLRAKPESDESAQPPAPRKKEPESNAHRWLEKLDAGLARVPESPVARKTERTAGIPVRRWENGSVPRPGEFPPSAGRGKNLPSESPLEEWETRVRASGRPGVGMGIETEASMLFGGAGSPAGEPIPPWIRDMIRRKVRGYLPELETVYSLALLRNPGLKGKLLIRFRIDASGTVQDAESMETSLPDAAFLAAVLEKVRRWTFEPTEGRTVDVLYPLVFFVPS